MNVRENADIWYRLTHWYPGGAWMGWIIFKRRFWKHPYLFHDNIGQRFYRIFGCKHRKARIVSESWGLHSRIYCFSCERWIE